jgi:hypothetical protein
LDLLNQGRRTPAGYNALANNDFGIQQLSLALNPPVSQKSTVSQLILRHQHNLIDLIPHSPIF